MFIESAIRRVILRVIWILGMLIMKFNNRNLGVCGHVPVLLYTFIYDMEKIITQDKNLGACCQHRSSSTLRTSPRYNTAKCDIFHREMLL